MQLNLSHAVGRWSLRGDGTFGYRHQREPGTLSHDRVAREEFRDAEEMVWVVPKTATKAV